MCNEGQCTPWREVQSSLSKTGNQTIDCTTTRANFTFPVESAETAAESNTLRQNSASFVLRAANRRPKAGNVTAVAPENFEFAYNF
jgi:hypothetical protein